MNVWRLSWRVSQQDRRTFWGSTSLLILFFLFPVLNGWLLGRAFSALQDGRNRGGRSARCGFRAE